jgi:hypothetical protein
MTTASGPTLGVVAVSYNQARFIPSFIERLGPQRDGFDEILFIDNCSSDDSHQRFQAVGFGQAIRRDDRILSTALNEAMSRLRSRWILTIAVDDLLTPSAARDIRAALAEVSSACALIYAQREEIDENGTVIVPGRLRSPRYWPRPLRGLLHLMGVIQPSATGWVLRRDAILGIRCRPEEWVEDYGLALRLGLSHGVYEAGRVWVQYRRTAVSWSSTPAPLDEASAVTRMRVINELWPHPGWRRSMALAFAAYSSSRSALGRGDNERALRFAVESLRTWPIVPVGIHTLIRGVQRMRRADLDGRGADHHHRSGSGEALADAKRALE